jgi:glycosyltransferase involved in cell wall biosynthesis
MKVLMLGWEFPPHISGGLGTACEGLVSGLATTDVEVTFVVPRLPAGATSPHARLFDCEVEQQEHHVPIDSALLPYLTEEQYQKLVDRQGHSGELGADLFEEVDRYARAVEKNVDGDYDVVHGHDWMTFPAAIAASEKLGIPLVLHVHSSEYDRAGLHANPRIVETEQRGLDAADRVICVSRYTAQRLRENFPVKADKLRIVHNAVEQPGQDGAPEPVPGQRIDEPIVLFLGRVTFQKGPEYFLEAAAKVVERRPRVKFVMAGAGDLLPSMIERAAELGLARHIHFTGFLRGAEVDRIYDEASLYVLSSVSEPFGIAALEALSRDVPVIVSKQSGVTEVLSNVIAVDFWDVQTMADHVVEILERPDLGKRLAEEGHADARRLTWDRQAQIVREVYREIRA